MVKNLADVVALRNMTIEEKTVLGWEDHPQRVQCFVLASGDMIVPAKNEEGNGPGAFFVVSEGLAFTINPFDTVGGGV